MEAADRPLVFARAGLSARSRRVRIMRSGYRGSAKRQTQAGLQGAPAVREGLGRAPEFMGCGPCGARGGRRRRVRPLEHADPMSEVSSRGDGGAPEENHYAPLKPQLFQQFVET